MLSRWLNTGIKAAERALREGRIDEAYQRVTCDGAVNIRLPQELQSELARALLARARVAAHGGHYPDAIADLERIRSAFGLDADGEALRLRVLEEQRHRAGRHANQNEAFAIAADNVKAGRLESGRIAVERLEDPQRREQLREELDIRVQRSEQLVAQARDALQQDDVLTACRFWHEAIARHGRTSASDELAARMIEPARRLVSAELAAGSLDRVTATITTLDPLIRFMPALGDLRSLVETLHEIAAALDGVDVGALRIALLKLRGANVSARWISECVRQVDEMCALHAQLRASPLGLAHAGAAGRNAPEPKLVETRARAIETRYAAAPGKSAPAVVQPRPLLMLIDGTGSALLLPSERVRIGRSGARAQIELGLPADIHSQHAEILRVGSDYFLNAMGPTTVNHRPVTRALLRDGDRIGLGASVKLVFRKPSVKSDTAVLQISDRCRPAHDVSVAVLFKDTCLIGPHSSCHIKTREGDSRVVLFERDGGLSARRAGRDGMPTGPAESLDLGRTRDIGDLRLTVKEYDSSVA